MFTYPEANVMQMEPMGRIYQIGDNFYPSITTVLGGTMEPEKKNALDAWKARVGKDKSNKIGTDAAQRGTNVHLMLERYLNKEDPKLEEFPELHTRIFKSLRLELAKINTVHGQEVVLFSETLGVAGRCDLVADYNRELSIVDYKTSSRVKSADEIGDYWLQAAFYTAAHNEMFGTDIKKMIILMGVENKLPMVFKKDLSDELLLKLVERITEYYAKL
jgi:ATP-dependent exoDNAse (exonuclease V) beta subunit